MEGSASTSSLGRPRRRGALLCNERGPIAALALSYGKEDIHASRDEAWRCLVENDGLILYRVTLDDFLYADSSCIAEMK